MAFQNVVVSIGGIILQLVVNLYVIAFISGWTATSRLYGLLEIGGSTVHLPKFEGNTLSFNTNNHSAEAVCRALDDANICVRGGFHCTALAHKALKTDNTGTVRVSFGIFNRKSDIDKLLSAINNFICK